MFVSHTVQVKYERDAGTRDVPIMPGVEEFVARMAQFKYERYAGTRDAPNKPRREEFA